MALDQIANALTYLEQFKLSAIYAVTVEDGVLKVIAANKDNIVLEYIWCNGVWV